MVISILCVLTVAYSHTFADELPIWDKNAHVLIANPSEEDADDDDDEKSGCWYEEFDNVYVCEVGYVSIKDTASTTLVKGASPRYRR